MEKLATVLQEVALLKVTVPVPLNLDHVWVSVLPAGKPSSVTVPFKVAVAGSVML